MNKIRFLFDLDIGFFLRNEVIFHIKAIAQKNNVNLTINECRGFFDSRYSISSDYDIPEKIDRTQKEIVSFLKLNQRS